MSKRAKLPESKPRRAVWRVGMREDQSFWSVKRAPGWRVVHRCDSLHAAAEWLTGQGVDLRLVDVVSLTRWRPLADFAASNV